MEPILKCAAGCGAPATVKWHDRLLCRDCAEEQDALLAAGKAYYVADRVDLDSLLWFGLAAIVFLAGYAFGGCFHG